MCAPKGSAFLYARPEAQLLVEPRVVSWGWHSATPGPSRFVDEQEWTGTRDIAAYLATPAAIEFMAQHEWDTVRARCHALAVETRRRVLALTDQPPLSGEDGFAQMFSAPLPSCNLEMLKARMYDEFKVEAPLVEWNGRQLMRVSVQGYVTQRDVDQLLTALAALLPQVRKES